VHRGLRLFSGAHRRTEGRVGKAAARILNPIDALITLELAADRIALAPQTGPEVVTALRSMRGKVARWRLLYPWEYLEFDAQAEPNRLIGAHQNLGAALNGTAHELKLNRPDPVDLARLKAARDGATKEGQA
jgi:hypothetical protein